MQPLLLTFTFLTLMALLTSSELVHQFDEGIKQAAFNSYQTLDEECNQRIALSAFEEVRESISQLDDKEQERQERGEVIVGSGKSRPLNYDHGRPPNNSRLNLHLIVNARNPEQHPLYEQLAQLMRSLYSDQSFFHEIPHLEYRLLETLIAYKELMADFYFVDECGALPFKDHHLHQLFLQMLKGSPPLLHYITFDKHPTRTEKKLNFMFAPDEILRICIPDEKHCEQALAFRQALWQRIDEQEANRRNLSKEEVKNRTYFKELLKNFLEQLDPKLPNQFDLTLGKKGGVIFIKDPLSGVIKRERIMKRRL